MNKSPLVSIIVSTYNRSSLLVKTINSMQRQTVRNIEIVVCDDGSTDNTADVIREIAKGDPRVRLVTCSHSGRPANPRNEGIRNSTAEWIAFCDDDDIWQPAKLEAQLFCMRKYRVKASCTNAWRFTYENDTKKKRYFEKIPSQKYKLANLLPVNPVICSSCMIHRSLIKKIYGFPESENLKALEDYALWLRVACHTGIYYLANPMVYYLETSSTSIRNMKQLTFAEQQAIVFNDFHSWLATQSFRCRVYYRFVRTNHEKDKKRKKAPCRK